MSDPLAQYDPPAKINDFFGDSAKRDRFRALWDRTVDGLIAPRASTNFYNPKTTRVGDAQPVRVEWTAFPKQTEDAAVSETEKFRLADIRPPQQERQYEYCEWCVQRDPATNKITRVTFTTESREYYAALWEIDPNCVLRLYRRHINSNVQLADLHVPGDPSRYVSRNKWNRGNEYLPNEGGSMHMIIGINTIADAVGLVAGTASSRSDLPHGGTHHADPMVILTVSRVVGRLGLRLCFSNPVGVYLQEPELNRIEPPASAPRDFDVADCWRVVRGKRSEGQALRAVFSVPERFGFTVSDLKIDGRPIEHGSQIARAVQSGTYVTPLPRP